VPALTNLLDRLRRMQPPPGAAAGVLSVPSAGDELAGEVSFLFPDLDQMEQARQMLLGAARSDAVKAEQTAVAERNRLLTQAYEEGERRAATILDERRSRARRRTRMILAEADRDASQIHARARERMPTLVAEIVDRLLEDSS
jgi:vacuolar-type H+-ATPase subunit H